MGSWELIGEENELYQAVVLKNYFQKYAEITGLFSGFQSFVITLDIVDKTDYVPTLLMCISFFFNLMIFFVSVISYTSIMGGVFELYYSKVNTMCVSMLICTTLSYYVSLMWSLHAVFMDSKLNPYMYSQVTMIVVSTVSGALLISYYFYNENVKRHTNHLKRIAQIKQLNQLN